MPKGLRTLRCEVLTPEGRLCRIEAGSVVFPADDGLVGILPGRAPLVAAIGAGPLNFRPCGQDKPEEYFVAGGFVKVRDDDVTILADHCEKVAEIDPEVAWDEIKAAEAMPRETDVEIARREEALTTARKKFALVQGRRKRLRQARLAAGGIAQPPKTIEQ